MIRQALLVDANVWRKVKLKNINLVEIWKQWAAGEETITTTFSPFVCPNPPKLKAIEAHRKPSYKLSEEKQGLIQGERGEYA